MSRGKCLAEVFVIYLGEMVLMQRKQTSFRRPQPEKTANPLKVRIVGNLFGTCGSCWKVIGGIGVAWEGSSIKVESMGSSVASQWLRLHISTAGVLGPIPGRRTKILNARWDSQKKKKCTA